MSSADISRERRTLVYQWWEEDNAALPPEHPGLEVTFDRCAEYATRLAATCPSRSSAHMYPPQRIMDWLQHPELYSPFVDMVAISRARDFDWDVLRNLTPDEQAYLARELAAMADPFDEQRDWVSRWAREHKLHWGELTRRPSQRRLRYLSGTPEERRRLLDRVSSYRYRNREVAA